MDTQQPDPDQTDPPPSSNIKVKTRDPPKARGKPRKPKWTHRKVRRLKPEDPASLIQNVSTFSQRQGQRLNHFFRRRRDIDVDPYGFQDLNFWSDRFADALELDASKIPDWPPGSNPDEGDLALDSCLEFWATYSQDKDPLILKRTKRAYRKKDPTKSKGRKKNAIATDKAEVDPKLAQNSTGKAASEPKSSDVTQE